MECYTCPRELLPVIESALAVEGYVVEVPIQRAVGSTRLTIMTYGSNVISLYEDLMCDMANIHIHGIGTSGGCTVREALSRLLPPILGRGRTL